jgi:chorismate mutase-like protein
MPAVADYKRRYNLPVEDTQQEQAVLKNVAAQARALGVNQKGVQDVFRVQIELAKQVQQAALRNPADRSLLPLWACGLDLSSDLRPALGELNDRIVHELTQVAPFLRDQTLLRRLTDEEITAGGVSNEV